MFYDRVKYTIEHADFVAEILEPLKWKEDVKTFSRHETYHGITTILSGELTFIGDARDFLLGVLKTYGVNANVRLVREIKNPETDIWQLDYVGWADLLTYKIDDKKFSCKFNTEPLTTLFKSKLASRVELERLTSITGSNIEPLITKDLYIEGRDILLTNNLAFAKEDKGPFLLMRSWDSDGSYVHPWPIVEVGDPNHGIIDVIPQLTSTLRKYTGFGSIDENFLDINETGQEMTYNISVTINQSFYMFDIASHIHVKAKISIFKGGTDYIWDRDVIIWEYEGDSIEMPKDIPNVSFPQQVLKMQIDESASLQWSIESSNTDFQIYSRWYDGFQDLVGTGVGESDEPFEGAWYINNEGKKAAPFSSVSVSIYEDSTRDPSTVPSIRIFEFAQRLSDIILEEAFVSDTLGREEMDDYNVNGYLSDLTLTHGMWLRGMYSGIDRFKPLSTSLGDFLTSLNVISPIGIDLRNNTFRLEDKSYFYQGIVTIKLGEVTDVIVVPDEKAYVTSITVGYEKAGGYDEEQGLDEYNRETQYNTIINKTSQELKLIAKYRADPYGLETIRRENPNVGLNTDLVENKDSKFDDHIWFVDANEVDGASNITVSEWSKRFSEMPSGIYSPETAFNLWLSPINIILKHGPWIKAPLLKYLDSAITFNYSEGNSALQTRLIGGKTYKQNVGVPVEDLQRSANKAEIASFKAPVTWEQLNGRSYNIPNIYGLVEAFYKGERYRGFIESVTLDKGIGDFKIKLYS